MHGFLFEARLFEMQVVRENDVIFQSPHQQHSFNFPYQLGKQEVDAANETPARAQVVLLPQHGMLPTAGVDL